MTTDEQVEILLTKGVDTILPSPDFLKKALALGGKLTLYCGFDPTAPTLHIGHTITLRKLRQFQDMGHRIIFLIGDFTARIGDPTDKGAARKQLSIKEIKINLKLYKKQAGRFIRFSGRNPAVVKFNSLWLGKLKFSDIIELASHMTVDQMLKRDMFVKRGEEGKPIYLHEFLYPLMQGYDSVAMNVDGEVGGSDQLFNMLSGRTLLKQLKNKEKFVLTTKLLEDNQGIKMGKSEGNMVSLLDTPTDMYGKIMSWTDGLIIPGFDLCTDYTPSQVADIKKELDSGVNPRDIKMRLAYEITKTCTTEKEAQLAQEAFVTMFQRKESADEIKQVSRGNQTFEAICLNEKLVDSKSELRRLIQDGAVMNFDTKEKMTDLASRDIPDMGTYKIGKNRFIKIV